MKKLCVAVTDEVRRDSRTTIRWNGSEFADVELQAQSRNLSTVEYIRRAVLHRRADLKIETTMILEIREVVAAIKALHAAYLENGLEPPEHLLGPVIQNAIVAILRLSRY